jgi:hypothetical protein
MRFAKVAHDFLAMDSTFRFYFAPLTQKLKKTMVKGKYNE